MVGEEGGRVRDVLEEAGSREMDGFRAGGRRGRGPGGEALGDGEEVRVLERAGRDGAEEGFEGV